MRFVVQQVILSIIEAAGQNVPVVSSMKAIEKELLFHFPSSICSSFFFSFLFTTSLSCVILSPCLQGAVVWRAHEPRRPFRRSHAHGTECKNALGARRRRIPTSRDRNRSFSRRSTELRSRWRQRLRVTTASAQRWLVSSLSSYRSQFVKGVSSFVLLVFHISCASADDTLARRELVFLFFTWDKEDDAQNPSLKTELFLPLSCSVAAFDLENFMK